MDKVSFVKTAASFVLCCDTDTVLSTSGLLVYLLKIAWGKTSGGLRLMSGV